MKLNLEPETIRTNVSFRLDNKVIEFIKELAKDNDASESKIMEHIIKDFMKRFVSINYWANDDILKEFEKYLESKGYSRLTSSGLPSTAVQYAGWIKRVATIEKMTIGEVILNLDKFVVDYGIGGIKETEGKQGHKSVINALRRIKEFIKSSNT
ncbi:MAG: hypothetical protein LBD63_02895 [Mycoplasmataceae bacterium]|nr:hypothetical protein [Mycoplasmataceae bacterium]